MTTTVENVSSTSSSPLAGVANPIAPDLDLTIVARGPTRLSDATATAIMSAPIPHGSTSSQTPQVSLVLVTHNNLVFTKLCVLSILANTPASDYELIVVDNDSTDGTVDWLGELASLNPHIRVIRNDTNRGFAPANNQGLAGARGDVLVLLNNDTVLTPGWLDGLRRHVTGADVGCVCACTNRIGNEAEVECSYRTASELREFALRRAREHAGELFDIRMAPMFCFALRRDVFEKLGPIDEQYELGMFEDDDYAMRLRAAGLRVCCADDVFVHHFGQASFSNLLGDGQYARTFAANRARFERKWGITWQPHGRRAKPDYEQLVRAVRAAAARAIPRNSIAAVITHGDDELLKLDGCRGWHFPRLEDGQYAGHHPADSAAAVAHLEELRAKGCQFLVIPQTSLWWLEHYAQWAAHLAAKYTKRESAESDDSCVIFELNETPAPSAKVKEHWQDRHLRELADAILPEGGWDDYVLVPQRRPLRADQLRGLRLIVRREGVGAIYERMRHT